MVFGQNIVEIVISARDKFSKAFNKAGLSMQNFRKSALAMGAVGGIIAFGLKKAVDASIELETAMVGVRKTTGMTAKETASLRQEFIDLSKVMPIAVIDLASIGEVAGQLGIQGTENIKSFTEVVGKMSIATELSAESAALALAKISNAMGLPINEAEKLGSAINELSNISAASSTEIISAMTRVSGSAKTLGLSTEVVAGLTASLIAAGEPAERAGTKLRSAFDQVVKNIKKVEGIMPGFSDALREDANGAILELIRVISSIEDPLQRQATAMDIFGTVGASAINKLSNNLPEMNKLIRASANQFENATSLDEEYNIALGSTANQVQLAKNSFTAMQLEIANVLMPALLPLIQGIRKVFEWFSKLPNPVKQIIVIFGAATAAIFLLAAAVALVTLVASPWLLILFAIAAAVAAVVLVIKNWGVIIDWLKEKLDPVFDFLKRLFAPQLAIIKLALKAIGIAAKWLWDNGIGWLWDKMKAFIGWIKDTFLGILGKVISIIGKVISKVAEVSESAGSAITSAGERVLGSRQSGGPINQTGLYKLHKGEVVIPSNKKTGVNIYIDNLIGLDPEEISRALSDELNSKLSL